MARTATQPSAPPSPISARRRPSSITWSKCRESEPLAASRSPELGDGLECSRERDAASGEELFLFQRRHPEIERVFAPLVAGGFHHDRFLRLHALHVEIVRHDPRAEFEFLQLRNQLD